VAEVVLVADDAIRAAQKALWDVLRIVAEPGGSAATAALLSGRYQPKPGSASALSSAAGTRWRWTSIASANPRKSAWPRLQVSDSEPQLAWRAARGIVFLTEPSGEL
jgi:threonine dehydratase